MEATAQLKYFRSSSRKVKLVIDLVRGKPVTRALTELRVLPQAAARPVAKLISSAVANAKQKAAGESKPLYLTRIEVGQGPSLKRSVPRAMGRGMQIKRPTSHLRVTVSDVAPKPKYGVATK